ncbi:MAG: hypothetical protein LBD70_04510 [Bifidobacteriaceae bacterium]|jgi:ornithine cyclodeaminase|nr:hypothetical protein [Bifidobacteriaceae bacterium]
MGLIESLFPRLPATPRAVDSAALAAALTPRLAIDAIRSWLESDNSISSQRVVAPVAAGDLLIMPAESTSYVGVKLVTVAPANPDGGLDRIQGVYQLFDSATLSPVAVFDAAMITAVRTAAVTAVAVDALAACGPQRLVVFGTSIQAESHVAALAEVRPLASVTVVGRRAEAAAALAGRLRRQGVAADWALTAHPAKAAGRADLGERLAEATLAVTATSASSPLFDSSQLPADCLVAAVGSHSPAARELDGQTLAGARIVVESRQAAWREYGELVQAAAEGAISRHDIAGDLRECVRDQWGPAPGRTVFKSAGMAWEDLAVAARAFAATGGQDRPAAQAS